jgi:acyl-CoA thioesterase
MLYEVYHHRQGKTTILGRVRAANQGHAVLKAYVKYKVAPEDQRYVGARQVKPLKPPAPLSSEEEQTLRNLVRGMNNAINAMKKFL